MIGFILGTIGIGLALLGLLVIESVNLIKKGLNEGNILFIIVGSYTIIGTLFNIIIEFFK